MESDRPGSGVIGIRAAIVADTIPIATVHCAAALAGYATIFPEDAPNPTPASLADGWRLLLNDPEVFVLVAHAGRGLVGVVALGPDPAVPSRLLLKRFYVTPSHWSTGVGSALHDLALDETRRRGATSLNLWVLEGNVRARAMYERRGWRLVPGPVLPNIPPAVVDVLYEMRLA